MVSRHGREQLQHPGILAHRGRNLQLQLRMLAGQPGQVQLQLQALAADAPAPRHVLVLPQAIAAQHRLAVGQTVTARPQAYGTEFVHDGSRQAFYLVLTDGFQRELAAQPVRL